MAAPTGAGGSAAAGLWYPGSSVDFRLVSTDRPCPVHCSREERHDVRRRRQGRLPPPRRGDHREAREEGGVRREARLPGPAPRLRRPHADGARRQHRRGRPARGHQRRRGRGGVRGPSQEGGADAHQLVAPVQEPRREAEDRRHLPGGRGRAEPLDPREGQGPVGGREAHARPGPPDPRVRAHVRAQRRRGGRRGTLDEVLKGEDKPAPRSRPRRPPRRSSGACGCLGLRCGR